jgi:hypothetical protein
VLHYVDRQFADAAEAYFDGERIRPPRELPPLPTPIDVRALDEVLVDIAALGANVSSREKGSRSRDVPATEGLVSQLGNTTTDGEQLGARSPVAAMLAALSQEIKAVDRKAPKRFRLRGGRCIGSSDGRFVYQFKWSSEPDLLTPGSLRVDKNWYDARVSGQSVDEDKTYELSVGTYLGPTVGHAVFRIDPTFLLRAVHEWLNAEHRQSDSASRIAQDLLAPPSTVEPHQLGGIQGTELNEQQLQAIRVANVSNRAYVWGPPGTGKTKTLGALVAHLLSQHKRVLVLSPYNVAVDQAMLAVCETGTIPAHAIVRFGRIDAKVRESGIDLDSHLERIAATNGTLELARQLLALVQGEQPGARAAPPLNVRACLASLGSILVASRASAGEERSKHILRALGTLRAAFRAPEEEVVTSARVVGTTVALSVVSSLVHRQGYDHLLIDEASVLRSPEAVVACLLTKSPVTFFGDPKQLPAIVQERSSLTAEWLARNPFAMAGIESPTQACGSCVMLKEQHRMAPPIRSVVSELFYEGSLMDGCGAPRNGEVLVLDSSRTPAQATSKMIKLSHSKHNVIHRHIIAEVVRAIRRQDTDSSILVLSPFVAQKRALKAEANTNRLAGVRFETIHTSQGSEADVVILDLVVTGGLRGGRSRMLDGRVNVHLPNLLNVGVSRAKRGLLVLGHLDFLEREYGTTLLGKLLAKARAKGRAVEVPRSLRCAEIFHSALASLF